jgi:hypothetical protein
MNDDHIAGIHTQIGRLPGLIVDEAVAHAPIGLEGIFSGEVDLQHAVLAPHIRRFADHAAGLRPRTSFPGQFLSPRRQEAHGAKQEKNRNPRTIGSWENLPQDLLGEG